MIARLLYTAIVGYLVFIGILAWNTDPASGALTSVCIVALVYVFDNHPRKGS